MLRAKYKNIKSLTSTAFQKAALASETEEVLICLVEISHESLPETIRLSSDMTEVFGTDEETGDPVYCTRHQGLAFFTFPFAFLLPGIDDDGSTQEARFMLGNMDYKMIQAIRELNDALTITFKIVMASSPNLVEYLLPQMVLTNVEYDAAQITGALGFKHFFAEVCPGLKFTPATFPGLFKG